MAGLLCGAQHLVDEALGLARPGAADAPGPDAKILSGAAHRAASPRRTADSAEIRIEIIESIPWSGTRPDRPARRKTSPTRAWMTTGEPLLSCRRLVGVPVCPPPSANQTRQTRAKAASKHDRVIAALPLGDACTNRPSELRREGRYNPARAAVGRPLVRARAGCRSDRQSACSGPCPANSGAFVPRTRSDR